MIHLIQYKCDAIKLTCLWLYTHNQTEFNISVMPLNWLAYGYIAIIRQKTHLDFSGSQTMTLSCDKNGSLLVKEKKIMVNHGINQGKMYIFMEITLVAGTFSPEKSRMFLEWSSCLLIKVLASWKILEWQL